jgi:hypothetical protein
MSLLTNSKNNRCSGYLGARMLVAMALLAGCGGGSSNDVETTSSRAAAVITAATATATSDTSASSPDGAQATGACRLITGAEAETALGVSTQPTTNKDLGVQNGLQHDTCAYASTDFQGVITVQLFTGAGAVADFAQQQLTYANKAKSVSGLGEEAFQLSSAVVGPGAGDLRFRVGSNEVQIEIHSDAPDLDAKLLELGRAAAGRL